MRGGVIAAKIINNLIILTVLYVKMIFIIANSSFNSKLALFLILVILVKVQIRLIEILGILRILRINISLIILTL
jgi:hypothetical protein